MVQNMCTSTCSIMQPCCTHRRRACRMLTRLRKNCVVRVFRMYYSHLSLLYIPFSSGTIYPPSANTIYLPTAGAIYSPLRRCYRSPLLRFIYTLLLFRSIFTLPLPLFCLLTPLFWCYILPSSGTIYILSSPAYMCSPLCLFLSFQQSMKKTVYF